MKRKQSKKTDSPTQRALRLESKRTQREQILERLALPIEARMNFLRIRLPTGGSCL